MIQLQTDRNLMTAELIRAHPCLRCGKRGFVGVSERRQSGERPTATFAVQCFSCGLRSRTGAPREAVDAWNGAHPIA